MTDFVQAWQCIGCGRIEAPQPCIGVCQDRKVRFVYAGEHEEALKRARRAERQADILKDLARRLAFVNPQGGQWEPCYRAMQSRARRVLATLDVGEDDAGDWPPTRARRDWVDACRNAALRPPHPLAGEEWCEGSWAGA